MQKLIIEARVNEYAMRDPNPRVPWTAEEIAADAVACREAGAAVLHFHAREPDGSPAYSYERYAEVVRAVRARSDLLVSPTLGAFSLDAPAEQRLAHILRLVEEGTPPDLAPMAMGSVNVDKYDAVARRYTTDGQIYKNSTAELTYFAEHIRTAGLKPYLVSWNVSFTRQTLAFLNGGLIEEPVYLCLHLTDGAILSGHPGTLEGLGAHLAFLPAEQRIEWTVCNYGGNLLALAAPVIARGGHISIGLGDYPYTELGRPDNAQLVRRIVEAAREVGREVATPEEARRILAIP